MLNEKDSKDLKMINDTLRALRDHFEAKGQTFMLAWSLVVPNETPKGKMYANMITTTVRDVDMLLTTSEWTRMALIHLDNSVQL